MKVRKEFLIGFLFIIAAGLLLWGLNFLKGKNPFEKENYYYALYKNVEGLTPSSKVTINGLSVGKVQEVYFSDIYSGKIIVKFDIQENIKIPVASVAEIYSIDLMGTKGIQIHFSDSTKFYSVGDTLKASAEKDLKEQVSAQVLPLKLKAEELMGSMDSVLTVVKYIFNKTNRSNIDKSFEAIKETFKNLQNTSITLDTLMQNEKQRLHNIFVNIESITGNLQQNNKQITNILENFSNLSDSLAKAEILTTINNANKALLSVNNILDKINRGEGSLGLLLNNDSLYNNLNRSSENLDKLLIDLRENPKRYLHYSLFDFGKTTIIDDSGAAKKNNKKKKDKKKNNDTSSLNYSIQIKSSLKSIKDFNKEFKGLTSVKEYYIDGRYKYAVGKCYTMHDAIELQDSVRKLFPDAFVVAFDGNKQIDIKTAKKYLN